MLSRLSSLWHSQKINESEEKRHQFVAALGEHAVFVFASSPQLIKQQHQVSTDEESFLDEFSHCVEAKKIVFEFSGFPPSSFVISPLFDELTNQTTGVFW